MKTLGVSRAFDAGRLPSYLECYSLLYDCTVVIEGQHSPYVAVYDPQENHITCDCAHFLWYGICDHVWALLGGLWAWLSELPPTRSLVACTRDWGTLSSIGSQLAGGLQAGSSDSANKKMNSHGGDDATTHEGSGVRGR